MEDNNYVNSEQEWSNDLSVFYDSYAEIILKAGTNKVASLLPYETINSRLSLVNPATREIEYHGFSTKWKAGSPDDIVLTPLLDRRIPILDMKQKLGLELDLITKKKAATVKKNGLCSHLTYQYQGGKRDDSILSFAIEIL